MADSRRFSRPGPHAAIARHTLAGLTREKTIVLALLIQLFVAAFSSFLVVGLVSLHDPGSVAAETIDVGVTGDATDRLVAAVGTGSGPRAVAYDSREAAMAAFDAGAVDAVIVARHADSRIAVEAIAPEGSLRTTLVVVQLRDALEAFERSERRQRASYLARAPVALPPEAPSGPYFGFTYTVLVPLLLFLPVFISGSVAVDAVTEEIERGTLELLRAAPVSLVTIVEGKAVALAALAPLQAGLWLALLVANGTHVAHVPELLLMVTALAVLVVAMGVLLGFLLGERQRAQLIYSVGILVVLSAAALFPEHPATTTAKLAVDSATLTTHASVAGYVFLAVTVALAGRWFVGQMDPERL